MRAFNTCEIFIEGCVERCKALEEKDIFFLDCMYRLVHALRLDNSTAGYPFLTILVDNMEILVILLSSINFYTTFLFSCCHAIQYTNNIYSSISALLVVL